MQVQRTANAGVRLTMDGVSILLDGLCHTEGPYLGTPAQIADEIINNPPDLLAFTHGHSDHFGESLVSEYRKQNLRPILGPESLPCDADHGPVEIGNVKITPIPTRHIGKVEPGLEHYSYLIEGSSRVLFTGDASPSQWKGREDIGRVDLLIAPYAYANTSSSWALSRQMADITVLLHLPAREKDTFGLWDQVESAAGGEIGRYLMIPEVGEHLQFIR